MGYIEKSQIVYSKCLQVASRDCEMQLHKQMDSYCINQNREFLLDCIIEFIETLTTLIKNSIVIPLYHNVFV